MVTTYYNQAILEKDDTNDGMFQNDAFGQF